MKKLPLSTVFLTSVVYLAGCSATNTQVRLLELTYALPGVQTQSARLNERNLPTKKNANTEEYIFPGDVLTFTVELEDPNFEFISLLAIKFNGVTIRANTNDSIVTTSDCGANICVNFPFEVSADVTEYTVEEVKFANLNGDSGINAIIDNQSQNSINLEIYTELVSPYVGEAVEKLNQLAESSTYISRTFSLEDLYEKGLIHTDGEIYAAFNEVSNTVTYGKRVLFLNYFTEEGARYNNISSHVFLPTGQQPGSKQFLNSTGVGRLPNLPWWFYYGLFTDEFSNTTFYNQGNVIYMIANNVTYEAMVFQVKTRLFWGSELGYSPGFFVS